MASNEFVTFESAFDDFAPVIDKRLFKQDILRDMAEKGMIVSEVPNDGQGGDVLLKRMDMQVAQGYNVFKKDEDYHDWLQSSLHEPTEDELMESLKEQNGTWA